MTSSTFDIEADNIFQGDSRAGLDEQGTQEVMEIMRRENVTSVSLSFVILLLTLHHDSAKVSIRRDLSDIIAI
jgi:hypothetical protein